LRNSVIFSINKPCKAEQSTITTL